MSPLSKEDASFRDEVDVVSGWLMATPRET